MTDGIEKIPLIERELLCLKDFKSDMTHKFDNRKPAELTIDFINETNLAMQHQTDRLESLTKTLDTHVADQKINDAKLLVDMEEYHKKIFQKLDEIPASFDKKYAPIMVYRILVWAGAIAGSALIVGLLTIIYRTVINLEK